MKWFIVYLFFSVDGQQSGEIIMRTQYPTEAICQQALTIVKRNTLPGTLGDHNVRIIPYCSQRNPKTLEEVVKQELRFDEPPVERLYRNLK